LILLKQIVVIVTSFVLLIAGIFTFVFLRFTRQDEIISVKQDYSFLQNGDLVLRRGKSVDSFAVFLLDENRDYSHIGIVCIENKVPRIIHIVPDKPDRVRKDPPEIFLSSKNASHYKIIRPDIPANKLELVAKSALDFFDRKLHFDNKYDLSTCTEMYCTELIIKAFEQNNIIFPDIKPQKIKLLLGAYDVIMPGSFLVSPQFICIISR
jgi:hypothetical protein